MLDILSTLDASFRTNTFYYLLILNFFFLVNIIIK